MVSLRHFRTNWIVSVYTMQSSSAMVLSTIIERALTSSPVNTLT